MDPWLRDSLRLFLLNLFLYLVLLEVFVLGAIIETAYHIDLPFFSVFAGGIFSFLFMLVWLNMSRLYYKKMYAMTQMFFRSALSEVPFAVFIGIAWIVYLAAPLSATDQADLLTLLLLFTMYLVLFPLIMVLTRDHMETVGRLEH